MEIISIKFRYFCVSWAQNHWNISLQHRERAVWILEGRFFFKIQTGSFSLAEPKLSFPSQTGGGETILVGVKHPHNFVCGGGEIPPPDMGQKGKSPPQISDFGNISPQNPNFFWSGGEIPPEPTPCMKPWRSTTTTIPSFNDKREPAPPPHNQKIQYLYHNVYTCKFTHINLCV